MISDERFMKDKITTNNSCFTIQKTPHHNAVAYDGVLMHYCTKISHFKEIHPYEALTKEWRVLYFVF